MNTKQRIWFSIAIAILSATALLAEVKTGYDRSADFSRYKTYSWNNVHTQNALWVDRIKAAVNSALAAKDFSAMMETSPPDSTSVQLARLGQRYSFRQIRQEHQKAQRGRAEDV